MVQGISNSTIKSNNIFSDFEQCLTGQTNNITAKESGKIDSAELNTSENKKSKNKKILFGSTLASTIITAGILGIVLGKGFHGSSFSKLSKITDNLSKQLQETSHTSTNNIPAKAVYYSKKGAKKTLEGLQATSNITAIKDWIADKIFRTNRLTAKFADKSKNLFKRIVDKTLGKKYDKVGLNIKDITSLITNYNVNELSNLDTAQKMQEVTIKGKTLTIGDWIEELKIQSHRLENAYSDNFSLGARRLRDKKRASLLSNTKDKVAKRFFTNKTDLFHPANYTKYVTEDVTKEAQKELKNDIFRAKRQVTNNISSIHDNIKISLNSLSEIIKPDDTDSRKIMQNVKKLLENFKSCSGSNEAMDRRKVSEEISSLIDNVIITIKDNSQYTLNEQTEIINKMNAIKKSVIDTTISSKGSLEEIMTILKGLNTNTIGETGTKIISDKNYKEFSRLSSGISKGLEKAAELEAGEYFLKQAELEVGSAATDVLSLLFPIGAGFYAVSRGDDNDEKISATLTTCIPLIGTFASFVYGTSKMFSGAKNLIFSVVTGAVLSSLGKYCDKLYKKYKESGSIVEVAKGEYDTLWTDFNQQNDKLIKNDTKNK